MIEKIGVMGGTFDPIHYGHLFIASEAKEEFKLERVIFVPCYQPPHKDRQELTEGEHRYRMVLLAVQDNRDFIVSSVELDRGGRSYSIETVSGFREKYGEDAGIYFIVGMDSLAELSSWRDIDELAERCEFIVATRPGWKKESSRWGDVVHFMDVPGLDISSTDIRDRVRCGRSIKYLVPVEVGNYINEHKLYRK